ncbi:energy transducer TonB [Ideonella sp.]|uniref:energy transducer TonB n=1 Tax=Ideonella sp. TaxID=1929293 RepID=UPI002B46D6BC|nr:energy transducer TonB [Ideonella sp.]HJV68940.1 energy transducer TonB [Ideonella sp.]
MTHLVRRLAAAGPSLSLAALLFHPVAHGQTATAPAVNGAEPSVSERVKKDAASPLYWIRLNAQKADATPSKPAPRIAEIRPVARPVPSPAGGGGGGNPMAAVASSGGAAGAPASTGPALGSSPAEATAMLAAPGALAAPNPAAAMPSAAAAGLVAPAASSAAELARAATTPPAPEEPEEPLALVKAAEPDFPANTMRRLRKGTVQVRFEVQPDGSVSNATVVQTSHRSLNEAALEAVSGWQFKPVPSARSAVVDLGFDLDS